MADKVNKQRALSKTTVNTSITRATSKTTQKSVLTTSSQQNGAPGKPILKTGGKKKDQKKENDQGKCQYICCLLYGRVVVALTHSPFPFSILFYRQIGQTCVLKLLSCTI